MTFCACIWYDSSGEIESPFFPSPSKVQSTGRRGLFNQGETNERAQLALMDFYVVRVRTHGGGVAGNPKGRNG